MMKTPKDLELSLLVKEKQIQDLKLDYQQANDIIVEQNKEIERLNSIIKDIYEKVDDPDLSSVNFRRYMISLIHPELRK